MATALIVALAMPALAAGPNGRTRGAPVIPDSNAANVQDTMGLSGGSITITLNVSPVVALTASAGQMATIHYNSTA